MWTQSVEVTRKETSVFTIRTIQKWEWGGGVGIFGKGTNVSA